MTLEWWMWIVGGIVLVMAELAIPAFFVIWFGLGALLVGVVTLFFPETSPTLQIALWILASLAMTGLWFKVFKPGSDKTRAGTATGEAIGEIGLLAEAVAPFQRGRVRFQRPLLGTDEWVCLADEDIPAGERVRVVGVEGSFLKIARI